MRGGHVIQDPRPFVASVVGDYRMGLGRCDEVRNATDSIGCHDPASANQGLIDSESPGFRNGDETQDVGHSIPDGHPALVLKSSEMNTRVSTELSFHVGFEWTGSHKNQMAGKGGFSFHLEKCMRELDGLFVGVQLACEKEDGVFVSDAQVGAHLLRFFATHLVIPGKELVVDRVGGHRQLGSGYSRPEKIGPVALADREGMVNMPVDPPQANAPEKALPAFSSRIQNGVSPKPNWSLAMKMSHGLKVSRGVPAKDEDGVSGEALDGVQQVFVIARG